VAGFAPLVAPPESLAILFSLFCSARSASAWIDAQHKEIAIATIGNTAVGASHA
jgi:hypothetical protein